MKLELATVKRKLTLVIPTLAGLALSFGAGCGSSGGTCGVAPCGGDVVGNWQASSACIDRATLNMDFLSGVSGSCPTASLGAVSTTPSGSVAFAADMTFTGTLALATSLDIIFPAACTGGASCAQLTQALQSLVGTSGITSASCAGSGSCTCTIAQAVDVINDTGTWATSGTTLTLAGAASPQGGPYCVKGSSLHLVDLDMATMMKVTGDLVLNKQ